MRDGWVERTLDSLAAYQNGYPFKSTEFSDSGLPVIRIKQLLDPAEPVDRCDAPIPERHRIRTGDLIFSWSGTLAVRVWDRGDAWLNQHLFRVDPVDGVDVRWLAVALEYAIGELQHRMHGTTMKHITKRELSAYSVALPPLSEQARIIHLVDAVQTVASRARKVSRDTGATVEVLRETLLACAEQRVPLSEVVEGIDGGVSPVADAHPPALGHAGVLKLSAIRPCRFVGTEVKALFPGTEMPERAVVEDGDVLITRSNTLESVGYACVVENVRPLTYLSDLTLRIHPDESKLDRHFLAHALSTRSARREIQASARGTSGSMRKISRGLIRGYTIPLPTLDEQRRIVAVLAGVIEGFDAAERVVERTESLRASLVADLLSGEHEIAEPYDELLAETATA